MSESVSDRLGDPAPHTVPEHRRRSGAPSSPRPAAGSRPARQGVTESVGATVEDLFAQVWSGEALSDRDRRLLLLGLLVGQGLDDMVDTQLDAALRTGGLTPGELRELVVFFTHYAGWTRGARLNDQVEDLLDRVLKD